MKAAPSRRYWFPAALGYTLAGGLSAWLTGAALGWLGRLAGLGAARGALALLLAAAGLVLAAREWRLISFPLPRPLRQTEKFWAHDFGLLTASVMWGFHIGLGFVTQVRHGGFWLVAAGALAFAEPRFGALLFVAYWFGRALSVWIAPFVFGEDALDPERLVDLVRGDADVQRHFQAVMLVWSSLALCGAGYLSYTRPAAAGLFALLS